MCLVNNRDFRKASNRIGQALKGETQGQSGRRDLAQLSPWFERFASPTGATTLLMPVASGLVMHRSCAADAERNEVDIQRMLASAYCTIKVTWPQYRLGQHPGDI